MRKMKKAISLLLAMVMVFAMSMTVMADEPTTYTITINNAKTGHKYVAYQILSGDLAEVNGAKVLSNIKWAAGQTTNAAGTDATAAFENKSDAEVKALVEGLTLGTASASSDTLTDGKYVITVSDPGYYLVKDEGTNIGNEDAYSAYIIKVVGNAVAEAKTAAPTVDKEVWDEPGDAENNAADGWGETADHAINESFEFKLTATLPADADYSEYEKYTVVFNDTMSDGITFESIESVKVNETPVTDYVLSEGVVGRAGGNWTLTIEDVLKYDAELTNGAIIEVVYKAHLNEAATIGNHDDNKNTVYLQYSNNPNVGGDGSLGRTKDDTVWVFTYDILNTKVDASNANAPVPLAGVEFKLYDESDREVGLIYDAKLTAYRPIKNGEVATALTSAETTGKFDIKGLDAGKYTLKETKALPGYNSCEDIEIVITATHVEDENQAGASTVITYNNKDTNTFTIENKKGATLPETGGIGTTIFYVVGALLTIGAVVLMITKKRMNEN